MYPTFDIELTSVLPSGAEYWTPQPDEITEEGFGFFRDVWPILGVTEEEARTLLKEDQKLSRLVGRMASSESEFDFLAKSIEDGVIPDRAAWSANKSAAIQPFLEDGVEE